MKKLFNIMATVIVALGFASCSNEAEEVLDKTIQKNNLKLNITVADIDGEANTRAVKTGWENGDKINIWYKQGSDYNVTAANAHPDLVIVYNGSSWTVDNTATVSGNTPAASGTLCVMYEGYNDLSQYTITPKGFAMDIVSPYSFEVGALARRKAYNMPLAVTAKNIEYTYNDEELTAEITGFKYVNNLQIVVDGISGSATDWAMSCNFTNPSNVYYVYGVRVEPKKCDLYSNDPNFRYDSTVAYRIAGGVTNGTNGAAFYFNVSNQAISNIEVTLYNSNGDKYNYTLPATASFVHTDKFSAGKIAFSKFVKQ